LLRENCISCFDTERYPPSEGIRCSASHSQGAPKDFINVFTVLDHVKRLDNILFEIFVVLIAAIMGFLFFFSKVPLIETKLGIWREIDRSP
jgi:hypothetical protein